MLAVAPPEGNEMLESVAERLRAQRMRGNLPAPVAAMLERSHGMFDAVPHDYHVVSGVTDLDEMIESVRWGDHP